MSTVEKETATAAKAEQVLTKSERVFQLLAYGAVFVGLVIIAVFAVKLYVRGYWAGEELSLTNSGTVGDFIGGVAGSLFALAGVLLFYVALALQRKEFRNSLHELRITSQALKDTEKHHRDTLQLMREEKEFGVCHVAVEALVREYGEFQHTKGHPNLIGHEYQFFGEEALEEISSQWVSTLFSIQAGIQANFPATMLPLTFERVFIRFTEVWLLNQRLFSLYDAIDHKLSGTWERGYLLTLLSPLMSGMYHGLELNVRSCLSGLEELEGDRGGHLVAFGITPAQVREWRKQLESLNMLLDVHRK